MPSDFSCVICQLPTSGKTKGLFSFLWTAERMLKPLLTARLSLPGLCSSTSTPLSLNLSTVFLVSVISRFSYPLQPFAFVSRINISQRLGSVFSYCSPFVSSPFILHPFTVFVSKLSHNADDTQQKADRFPSVSELSRSLAGRSGSRVSQAHGIHYIFGSGYRQGRDSSCRRTSVYHTLSPDGGAFQRPGPVRDFCRPWKAQREVKW